MQFQTRIGLGAAIISALLASMLVAAPASGAATFITAYTTITTEGNYLLTKNFNGGGSFCITISASNVTLDLSGFTIDCGSTSGAASGLSADASTGKVKVADGIVTDSTTGVAWWQRRYGAGAKSLQLLVDRNRDHRAGGHVRVVIGRGVIDLRCAPIPVAQPATERHEHEGTCHDSTRSNHNARRPRLPAVTTSGSAQVTRRLRTLVLPDKRG